MTLGGRPKEEGGHKDWHLTFNKITSNALEKIRKKKGKASEVLEKAFEPIAEKYDPGELSIHIWRYEVYLSQEIIQAAQEGKTESVQALAALANAVKDYRSMCGLPLANSNLPITQVKPSIETYAWQQKREEITKLNMNGYSLKALDSLGHFIFGARVPKPQKEKLLRKLSCAYSRLNIVRGYTVIDTAFKKRQLAYGLVLELLSNISEIVEA